MRWAMLWMILLSATALPARAATGQDSDPPLYGTPFKLAGLSFTIPYKWHVEPAANSNHAGQWHIPPPHADDATAAEGAEVAVLFFGPNIGGGPKENIAAWNAQVLNAQGHPAPAKVTALTAGGLKITLVSIFGAYQQPRDQPGLPPLPKPKFGLLGAVVETPQGNIFWRVTGPEALLTPLLPLFTKVVASVKPQAQDKP